MVGENKDAVVIVAAPEFGGLPEKATAQRKLTAIREFQALCRQELIQGHDYGIIPGTQKPTLLKPGAEKIAKLLVLADHFEILDKREDWDRPLFRYLIRCTLADIATGKTVSTGLGECNSMESKYRYRWLWPSDADSAGVNKETAVKRTVKTKRGMVTQYRTENEDIYSQVNTILKMAKKRALVDAALSAGRLSDIFTQDLEDLKAEDAPEETGESPQKVENGIKNPDQANKKVGFGHAPPATSIATPGPTTSQEERPRNFGELFNRAYALDRRLVKPKVLEALGVKDQAEITDYAEAWEKIMAWVKAHPVAP